MKHSISVLGCLEVLHVSACVRERTQVVQQLSRTDACVARFGLHAGNEPTGIGGGKGCSLLIDVSGHYRTDIFFRTAARSEEQVSVRLLIMIFCPVVAEIRSYGVVVYGAEGCGIGEPGWISEVTSSRIPGGAYDNGIGIRNDDALENAFEDWGARRMRLIAALDTVSGWQAVGEAKVQH